MEEQLISFETAKLAKEKGFNEICDGHFEENGGAYNSYGAEFRPNKVINEVLYARPTQALLQKWLREVHNCFIDILPHRDGDSKNKQWKSKKDVFWTVEVDYYGKNFEIPYTENADFVKNFNRNYEKALEIGIFQALKLIK